MVDRGAGLRAAFRGELRVGIDLPSERLGEVAGDPRRRLAAEGVAESLEGALCVTLLGETLLDFLYSWLGSGRASMSGVNICPRPYAGAMCWAMPAPTQVPLSLNFGTPSAPALPLAPDTSKLARTHADSAFSCSSGAVGKAALNIVVRLIAPVSYRRRINACPGFVGYQIALELII